MADMNEAFRKLLAGLDPGYAAKWDQAQAGLADYARACRLFYTAMVDAGFTKGDALAMLVNAQASIINTLPELLRVIGEDEAPRD